MSGKAGWMTGAMLGAALLVNGAAMAQSGQGSDYGYPQADDRQPQDEGYADDDLAEGAQRDNRSSTQPRADDDFSDVTGEPYEQAQTDARAGRDGDPSAPTQDAWADREREEATTECAVAAREEAERDGGFAEVRQVQEPRESRDGYEVEGDIDARSSWRATDGQTLHFTCSVETGRIVKLNMPRGPAAR